MESRRAEDTEAGLLDREQARRDERSALRARLAGAGVDYLEGALENPNLGPEELLLLLRNNAATAEIVTRVVKNRAWMGLRDVKIAVVGSPRAPQVLARRFLPHLYWRDLAAVAGNLRLSPVLRREAEKLLKTRLPEMSAGEKVALARRGSRGVVEALADESDGLVLRAIAGNPRTTEADVARVLSRQDVPATFLSWLADQSSWGSRRGIRLALVRHPRTPASSSLRLTQTLSLRDAEDLRRDVHAPRLVRVAAERRLEAADPGSPGARPHLG